MRLKPQRPTSLRLRIAARLRKLGRGVFVVVEVLWWLLKLLWDVLKILFERD